MKWPPSVVSGLTMGEMQRIMDDDPQIGNGQEAQVVVIARRATFEETWERNRSLPWR